MIDNIMAKVDFILIGGGMAASFLKAQGYDVGSSMVEADIVDVANRLIRHARESGVKLLLPEDAVVTDGIIPHGSAEIVAIGNIPAKKYIADIGPKTIDRFRDTLQCCRSVFWNGPMGIYEIKRFAAGTRTLAKVIAGLEATTVIGGGSTAEAITGLGLADKVSFVSTGGGASLDFLSGKILPGIAALPDRKT
jgi:phosphoglycerate kinase